IGATTGGGAGGAGGTVGATGAGRAAGGADAAGRLIAAGGLVPSGTESKESGQLEIGSEVAAGVESDELRLIVEDGGQAGIACSVGGSGGHTSVSSGIAPWRGATSSRRGTVGGSGALSGEVCGPPAGGHVRLAVVAGSSGSAPGSPGAARTVCAHFGAGFFIGAACFGSVCL